MKLLIFLIVLFIAFYLLVKTMGDVGATTNIMTAKFSYADATAVAESIWLWNNKQSLIFDMLVWLSYT